MTASTTLRPVSLDALLRLGRVSNLPTVWTNVLAATVIAGGDPLSGRTGQAALAMTLFYVGGMYLNDAFDRAVDGRERPSRPIPAGEISAAAVFAAGFGMLGLGAILMALHGLTPALAGLALAAAIVLYNAYHKGNPVSPVLMGLCRILVYVGAAAVATGGVPAGVLLAGAALLAHVAGLTYAAKQESLDRIERLWPLAVLALPLLIALPVVATSGPAVAAWAFLAATNALAVHKLRRRAEPGAVPRAVAALIAGISLVDALFAAAFTPGVMLLCWAGYGLTRLLQRVIPGT